jgi:shikimate dehydrogenase
VDISGHTKIWGILADPIGHVRTPQALNAMMARNGIDGVMIPVHVAAEGLATIVQALRLMRNLEGFVVTVPHKTAMAGLCDEVSHAAASIGAVNVVRRQSDGRLIGGILDGLGFLAEANVGRMMLANRTRSKSLDLAARLAEFFPDLLVDVDANGPAGYDLVVNATSLGLRVGDPLPVNVESLKPGQIVAEILMEPAMTPLLVEAQHRGCTIHTGRPMLECQLDLMAEFLGMASSPKAVGL